MAIYTVHEPPVRLAAAAPTAADRFIFVRDGFSVWAFLFAPLWMLWHRAWLVLISYVVLWVGLAVLLKALGASGFAIGVVGLLISLLIGLEAGTLRRLALSRRGWSNVGVVSGHDIEDAERRFFDSWLRQASSRTGAPPPSAGAAGPATMMSAVPRAPHVPDVVGLFPEPGGQR